MLKKMTLLAAAFSLVLCVTVGTSFAEQNKGPEEIVLKTAKAAKPAKFPHKKHQDKLECSACHHSKTADGKQGPYIAGEEKKCETCHNGDMANAKLNSFKNAGHAACKECHKKEEKGGNKNAPTKCNGCHVKE